MSLIVVDKGASVPANYDNLTPLATIPVETADQKGLKLAEFGLYVDAQGSFIFVDVNGAVGIKLFETTNVIFRITRQLPDQPETERVIYFSENELTGARNSVFTIAFTDGGVGRPTTMMTLPGYYAYSLYVSYRPEVSQAPVVTGPISCTGTSYKKI